MPRAKNLLAELKDKPEQISSAQLNYGGALPLFWPDTRPDCATKFVESQAFFRRQRVLCKRKNLLTRFENPCDVPLSRGIIRSLHTEKKQGKKLSQKGEARVDDAGLFGAGSQAHMNYEYLISSLVPLNTPSGLPTSKPADVSCWGG